MIDKIAAGANDIIMDALFPRKSSPTIRENLKMAAKKCKESFNEAIIIGTNVAKNALFPRSWSNVTKESNAKNLSSIEIVGKSNIQAQKEINEILRKEVVFLQHLLVSQEERITALEKNKKAASWWIPFETEKIVRSEESNEAQKSSKTVSSDLSAESRWLIKNVEELPVLLDWKHLAIPKKTRQFRWKK